jgi:hypothetical protein
MEINDKLIIDCAVNDGYILYDDVVLKVSRGKTMFDKDLGEWWISDPKRNGVWVVKDDKLKAYIREIKLDDLGI